MGNDPKKKLLGSNPLKQDSKSSESTFVILSRDAPVKQIRTIIFLERSVGIMDPVPTFDEKSTRITDADHFPITQN